MQLINGDCAEVLKTFDDSSVDAIVTDPPYNIGKAKWDKIPDYLSWCESWIKEASRVCKRQGAFWCFHSEPLVLADIAKLIEQHGRPLRNWITWDKPGFRKLAIGSEGLRMFFPTVEYIVYHADDGAWSAQSDECRGFIFEPIRKYLADEWQRAGLKYENANEACGTASMAGRHYFSRSQWCLPTAEHYANLQRYANGKGGDYLRKEYEDLRKEYEDLRPTFNNPGKISSVWQFPPAKAAKHPTTKPAKLMERIIAATTTEGDVVLDPFMGSGTTGVACHNLNRRFIGIEKDPDYFEIAKARIEHEKNRMKQMELF